MDDDKSSCLLSMRRIHTQADMLSLRIHYTQWQWIRFIVVRQPMATVPGFPHTHYLTKVAAFFLCQESSMHATDGIHGTKEKGRKDHESMIRFIRSTADEKDHR